MSLDDFIHTHMRKSAKARHLTPARLQAALALLEKLRELPSLRLEGHLAKPGSSGLKSHETFGDRALKRFNVMKLNKNHGRRSSSLRDWGQELLDLVAAAGFATAKADKQARIIETTQTPFAKALRAIIEQEPLEVRLRGKSALAVIRDVIHQADEKGKGADVAQYLVGAKLLLRFDSEDEIPVHQANKGDRSSHLDDNPRLGDFEFGDAVIEIALGIPDPKHLNQVVDALEDSDKEVWLLTRTNRVETWIRELAATEGIDMARVVVTSVEAFVGQNITELARFGAKSRNSSLKALFDIYNDRWVNKIGFAGILIVAK